MAASKDVHRQPDVLTEDSLGSGIQSGQHVMQWIGDWPLRAYAFSARPVLYVPEKMTPAARTDLNCSGRSINNRLSEKYFHPS